MSLHEVMEGIAEGFEVAGVAILVLGALLAFASAAAAVGRGDRQGAYQRARQNVGRSILLGLEVLIIADIVLTITVDRTFDSALSLGLIVVVRTFLSFSIGIELDGVLPWRRGAATGRSAAAADERPG